MQLKKYLFILFSLCLGVVANAQPRESVEGVHYQALAKPVQTETDSDHIEVREIFWYGCPQCSTFEPIMSDWRDGVTGDLVFVRTPAVLNEVMALHARIYYTGLALEAEDQIHQAAFKAIHLQSNSLRAERQIKDLFIANGVSAESFDSAWNSTEVLALVQQAEEKSAAYGIDKLPAVIVNGRYKVIHNDKVFDHVELNIAVNMVVFRMRDERRSDF